jgi:hypothetical protein
MYDCRKRSPKEDLLHFFVDFDSCLKKGGIDRVFPSEELYQLFILKIDIITVEALTQLACTNMAKAVKGVQELARREEKMNVWSDNPIPMSQALQQAQPQGIQPSHTQIKQQSQSQQPQTQISQQTPPQESHQTQSDDKKKDDNKEASASVNYFLLGAEVGGEETLTEVFNAVDIARGLITRTCMSF